MRLTKLELEALIDFANMGEADIEADETLFIDCGTGDHWTNKKFHAGGRAILKLIRRLREMRERR